MRVEPFFSSLFLWRKASSRLLFYDSGERCSLGQKKYLAAAN